LSSKLKKAEAALKEAKSKSSQSSASEAIKGTTFKKKIKGDINQQRQELLDEYAQLEPGARHDLC